jgi:hypothetical protein
MSEAAAVLAALALGACAGYLLGRRAAGRRAHARGWRAAEALYTARLARLGTERYHQGLRDAARLRGVPLGAAPRPPAARPAPLLSAGAALAQAEAILRRAREGRFRPWEGGRDGE